VVVGRHCVRPGHFPDALLQEGATDATGNNCNPHGDDGGVDKDLSSCVFGLFQGNDSLAGLGGHCNENQCDESPDLFCSSGLLGLGRQCFPTAVTCLAALTNTVQETCGFDGWRDVILHDAGVSVEDLAQSRKSSCSFEAFQETSAFSSLHRVLSSNPPAEALRGIKQAADGACSPVAAQLVANKQSCKPRPQKG